MIRITYEQGNGYRCGCCRQTWTETEDFESREEVLDWLIALKASQTISMWEDEDDRSVISIEEQIGEDISGEFIVDPQKVEERIAYRKGLKQKEKEKEEAERSARAKKREKAELRRLVKKYPELAKETQ